MSTATAAPVESVQAEAEKDRHTLFKWSQWVHVGPGAEECASERGEDEQQLRGTNCSDPNHFHAWVRLPNPFQLRDINGKALAAQARLRRALFDERTDERVVLEADLDELRHSVLSEAEVKALIADEVVDKDAARDYMEAVRQVEQNARETAEAESDEETTVESRWAHIDQDREEYHRLKELAEEDRGPEFERLREHLADYNDQVEQEIESKQTPRRVALIERPLDELIDLARRDRIDLQCQQEFLHTFNTWQWFVCTYKPRLDVTPHERVFSDITTFKYETDTDVLETLQDAFQDLERRLTHSRAAKNS